MASAKPATERDLMTFRSYWRDGELVSEGRRRGLDPPSSQMKEVCKMMAEAVPMNEGMIEVVMTVRPVYE